MDVRLVRERDFFNGKEFHLFIYNKTESATGLHQHDYYEYTLILTGMCYQEINGKRVFLERGTLSLFLLVLIIKVSMSLVPPGS